MTAPAPDSGPWTLVTGASSGIGRALALRFARAGHRLVLVGRDRPRLESTARDAGVRSIVVAEDLSDPASGGRLEARIRDEKISVSVLVNNAGMGVVGPFARTPLDRELEMIRVGVASVVDLTKRLLPAMIRAGRGGILNVGSAYCFFPVPDQAVYAATKAFLLSWSLSLAEELRGTGVRVSLLCPGATRTELRRRAGVSDEGRFKGMSAEATAEAGYRAFAEGRLFCLPGAANRVLVGLASSLPLRWRAPLLARVSRLRGMKSPV